MNRDIRGRARIVAGIGLLAAVFAACHPAPPPSLSLLDHTGEAEFAQEAAGGNLIYPAGDARRRGGWSEPEPGPVIWAMGKNSSLQFFLTAPRPLRLVLAAHPLPYPDAPEARLGVSLNGTPLPPVVLQSGWQDTAATMEIPEGALQAGWNLLAFSHPWARRPVEFGQGDPRPLAVNFSKLTLEDLKGGTAAANGPGSVPAGGKPDCTKVREKCLLPDGSALQWSFLLPSGARLHICAAGEGVRLRVLSQQDGAPAREIHGEKLRGVQEFSVALKGAAAEPLVLTLAAEGGAVTLSEVRFSAPELPADWRAAPGALPANTNFSSPQVNAGKPATVLIFLVDALRADHLSVYGYARPTSPQLAQFSATAERFDDALAVTSWTKPTVATILTGLPPEGHGAGLHLSPLRPEAPYLPELFRAAGYRTVAVSASPNVNAALGFARGFDEFDYLPPAGDLSAPANAVLEKMAAALKRVPSALPVFLYVHILEPHTPYLPPVEFNRFNTPGLIVPAGFDLTPLGLPFAPPAILQNRRDRYDGEVLAADDAFGGALALLRAAGRSENALVIFVADHGEEFGEHDGLEHGETLYPEVLRIPLLIRWPDGRAAGAVNSAPVSQLDLAPTLRAAAGLPASSNGSGFPLQSAAPAGRRRYASLLDGDAVESLRDGRWELQWIHRAGHFPGKATLQLYDLAADPDELHDLADKFPARAALMRGQLRSAAPARAAKVAPQADDPELLKQLKALGYLL